MAVKRETKAHTNATPTVLPFSSFSSDSRYFFAKQSTIAPAAGFEIDFKFYWTLVIQIKSKPRKCFLIRNYFPVYRLRFLGGGDDTSTLASI